MTSPALIVGLIVLSILAVAYLLMRWADSMNPLDTEHDSKETQS